MSCRLLAGDAGLAKERFPEAHWVQLTPERAGMDAGSLAKARDYALTGGGAGCIIRYGGCVLAWGDVKQRYDLKSTTKSIGVTALGLAMADGKLDLMDRAIKHHPTLAFPPETNRETGWVDRLTIEQLATQTAGFEKSGGYTKLMFEPGTKWAYSDGGPNWLAECITLVYGRDVAEIMAERVFRPLDIKEADLTWRRNSYRPAEINGIVRREFGSGISANVDAMARLGYLYLRGGRWRGRSILPGAFVEAVGVPPDSVLGLSEVDPDAYGNASDHYGLLWWNNADGTLSNVPRDAFWAWGLYDSLILVIPSLDIVVARAGQSWKRHGDGHYEVLRLFFEPIVASVPGAVSPYPPSPVIQQMQWERASCVMRLGHGSDTWPVTWGDDDLLYTAFGDGRGFEPYVEEKLSMGLATVAGSPQACVARNLRSGNAERKGDGAAGAKASSLLMIDGVLFMWVRNTGNSQLAWSSDHGRTWTWSDWRFSTSFGYPVFLNCGKNYAGSRDAYVYVYSPDGDSAYERADRMVLARVQKHEVVRRDSYEFFVGMDGDDPLWAKDLERRGAVFQNPGQCYRSSVSYNAGLKRYLWCQTGLGEDPRFEGGLAIYDAPEPWGPWSTVFHSFRWDMGPGETSCLPTKWMSEDGLEVHLVFSGLDAFSVRRGRVRLPR